MCPRLAQGFRRTDSVVGEGRQDVQLRPCWTGRTPGALRVFPDRPHDGTMKSGVVRPVRVA